MAKDKSVKELIAAACANRERGKKNGCTLCNLMGQNAKDLEEVLIARRDQGLILRHAIDVLRSRGIRVNREAIGIHYKEHWNGLQ